MNLLKLGGYLNLLISIGHLVGLFWAEQMFELTGISSGMKEQAKIHASLPYLSTIFVAIVFFIFGLYGLSAGGKISKLPFMKLGIFGIAAIYIFRGAGELIFDMSMQQTNAMAETSFSLIALAIGSIFLFGGLKKWKMI